MNIDTKLQKKNCQGTDISKLEFLEMETKGCGARCCIVTHMLLGAILTNIYIGTPMVTAGLWKRKDIDSLEASLYRKIMFLSNSISNKAILNTMTSIRLAGDAIENLVKRTREDAER